MSTDLTLNHEEILERCKELVLKLKNKTIMHKETLELKELLEKEKNDALIREDLAIFVTIRYIEKELKKFVKESQ